MQSDIYMSCPGPMALYRDLIETYKMLYGKENIESNKFFELSDNAHNLRGHSMKIPVKRSRLNVRKSVLLQSTSTSRTKLEQSSWICHDRTINENIQEPIWAVKALLLSSSTYKYK